MARTRRRLARLGNRGFLLISSYLVLSLFLMYSSAMTLRTNTQRMVSDQLRDRYQATDLAQAALEQLRDDVYQYFRVKVYQNRYASDALSAMGWLDALKPSSGMTPDPNPASTDPNWKMPETLATGSTVANAVTGVGTVTSPRRVTLPDMTGKNWTARAWIADVTSTGVLSPRNVTLEAVVARPNLAGGEIILKRLRAVYRFDLAASDIFRYAYFVNNYGWFDLQSGWMDVNGEVRSNGDFRFSGALGLLWVDGDIFASQNAELVDPTNPLSGPSQGLIYGDPAEDTILPGWYFNGKKDSTRPERRKTFPGQPTIGGGPISHLPSGQGWDTDYVGVNDPNQPDQRKSAGQSTQDIPYLGDLSLYRTMAQQANNNTGSSLTFATAGPDGQYDTGDDGSTTLKSTYTGTQPLVIVGTWNHPIQINGPFVASGDVIIKGWVQGQGTIYAGRNVHVVGDIVYWSPPEWPSLWRDPTTGQISAEKHGNLGYVCNNGNYQNTPCK